MLVKKSLLLISILGALSAAVAHADDSSSNNSNDVNLKLSIPNLKSGFEYDFTALALKPGASNLNYAILNHANNPAQSPYWTEEEIKPGYSPAFELGVRYKIPNGGGKDISLDWTHMISTTSTSVAIPNQDFFIGPDWEIGPDQIPGRAATGKAEFRYDVINLSAGQALDFGKHAQMHFFGGLSTALLRENVISDYSGDTADWQGSTLSGPFNVEQDVTANFTGIGPRLGLALDFHNDYGWGVMGEAAGSALIGSSYARTDYASSSPYLQTLFHQSINDQTITDTRTAQVVPGFDAKLGVNYKRAFSKDTLLTVEAGYQGAVYVNAINEYLPQSLVHGDTGPVSLETGGIYVATMSHTQSNYSVHGPFLKFAVQF